MTKRGVNVKVEIDAAQAEKIDRTIPSSSNIAKGEDWEWTEPL